MAFRRRRGIKVGYKEQGMICFTCLNYPLQSVYMRRKIDRLCLEVGREDKEALFALVTQDESVTKLARLYYISERKLYDLRKQFYEKWFDIRPY